mmetsp:Transcript_32663/g.80881  ORF Transcript_32663/g.80881 Transcript_32663/m.80881 type:complete len:250 (-) Transcript_32663:180-929(-)
MCGWQRKTRSNVRPPRPQKKWIEGGREGPSRGHHPQCLARKNIDATQPHKTSPPWRMQHWPLLHRSFSRRVCVWEQKVKKGKEEIKQSKPKPPRCSPFPSSLSQSVGLFQFGEPLLDERLPLGHILDQHRQLQVGIPHVEVKHVKPDSTRHYHTRQERPQPGEWPRLAAHHWCWLGRRPFGWGCCRGPGRGRGSSLYFVDLRFLGLCSRGCCCWCCRLGLGSRLVILLVRPSRSCRRCWVALGCLCFLG